MSCYLVQESDGTSRFILEDGTGFLLLEFCPPAGAEYNPMGDRSPSLLEGPELRRVRRRRRDEEIIAVLLDEL